ncbi:MAG TPA: type II toxin-antitoxin system prevent-host-death family antitoxin [Ktedonobacteraceae bacterium]|nr:type II toxin-antitoxin system prevent-host-death family antitoxin [Ktedonobacteraceae bacterium]HXZ04918.1 type II toxin-antitoxin system prevent-host-death family antitoxin [Ktedonobacteraceae bacterium]
MKTLGVRELKERISEILRLVEEEGETVEVTKRGEVIAHLVPVRKPQRSAEQADDAVWTDLERLAAEINANWPSNVSAVDAVRDVRREL